jgi:hypothetical protein
VSRARRGLAVLLLIVASTIALPATCAAVAAADTTSPVLPVNAIGYDIDLGDLPSPQPRPEPLPDAGDDAMPLFVRIRVPWELIEKVPARYDWWVLDGLVRRNVTCRLIRDNVVIHTGTVSSLRRFKENVQEVGQGVECGMEIENLEDLQEGDLIEILEFEESKRTL